MPSSQLEGVRDSVWEEPISYVECIVRIQTDKFIPRSSDGSKVALGDPGIPVVLQNTQCRVVILILTERPFVDNGRVASIVKDAWSDPWLCSEQYIVEEDIYNNVAHTPRGRASHRGSHRGLSRNHRER